MYALEKGQEIDFTFQKTFNGNVIISALLLDQEKMNAGIKEAKSERYAVIVTAIFAILWLAPVSYFFTKVITEEQKEKLKKSLVLFSLFVIIMSIILLLSMIPFAFAGYYTYQFLTQ